MCFEHLFSVGGERSLGTALGKGFFARIKKALSPLEDLGVPMH
jgi:hypothetical protein